MYPILIKKWQENSRNENNIHKINEEKDSFSLTYKLIHRNGKKQMMI